MREVASDWSGGRDSRERPHGRGTLRLGKRARYEGRLHHGVRCGVGTLLVDEGDSDDGEDPNLDARPFEAGRTSALRVAWVDGVPHGASNTWMVECGLLQASCAVDSRTLSGFLATSAFAMVLCRDDL